VRRREALIKPQGTAINGAKANISLPAARTEFTDAAFALLPMPNGNFGVLSKLKTTALRQVLRNNSLKVRRSIPGEHGNAELKVTRRIMNLSRRLTFWRNSATRKQEHEREIALDFQQVLVK